MRLIQNRHSFFCVVLTTIFLLAAFGCSKNETILRVALEEIPTDLRGANRAFYTEFINRNIYEPLARVDNDKIVLVLLEYWFQESDTLFTLKIREDIQYSDGTFMTAEDVKKSMEINYEYRSRSFVNQIEVETYDDFYLRVAIKNLNFRFNIRDVGFIYKEIKADNDDFFSQKIIGTGEYVLAEYNDANIKLVKNKYHRNVKKNKKSPDIIEIIAESDSDKRYNMFLENKIDFLRNIPLSAYGDQFDDPDVTMISDDNTSAFLTLSFDTLNYTSRDTNLSTNPFRNKKVRQAVAHALDMRGFVETHLKGMANILVIPVLQRFRGYPNHLEYYRYDVDLSKSLLEQSGYADGFDIKITVMHGNLSIPVAEFIKESLKAVNINVDLDIISVREFDQLPSHPNSAMRPIATISGRTQEYSRNYCGCIRSFSRIGARTGTFAGGYRENEQIWKLIQDIEGLNEYDSRLPMLYREVSELIYDEVMYLPLFQPFDAYVLNNKFIYEKQANQFRFVDFKAVR